MEKSETRYFLNGEEITVEQFLAHPWKRGDVYTATWTEKMGAERVQDASEAQ